MTKKQKKKIKRVIRRCLLLAFILFIILAAIFPFFIKLNGNKNLEIGYGSEFTDPGARAFFGIGRVKIKGSVNTAKLGEYKLVYTFLTERRTRKVSVVDKTAPELELFGDANMYVAKGSSFEEPGFKASDEIDGDLTSGVEIDLGGLNTDTIGVYTIKYVSRDSSGNAVRQTRKVSVVEGPESMSMAEFDLNPFYGDVICKETEYSEAKYKKIIFFGDSQIERFGERGYISYNQLWSRVSTSTDDFYERPIYVYCYLDGETTFFDAMDREQPEVVYFLLNTDWSGRWTPEYLEKSCDAAYSQMKSRYPDTTFIIGSIMPVDIRYDSDEHRTDFGFDRNDYINKMNVKMCELCRKYGFKFMNAAECVRDPLTGACLEGHTLESDGIHLSDEGCELMLEYIKNHMDW